VRCRAMRFLIRCRTGKPTLREETMGGGDRVERPDYRFDQRLPTPSLNSLRRMPFACSAGFLYGSGQKSRLARQSARRAHREARARRRRPRGALHRDGPGVSGRPHIQAAPRRLQDDAAEGAHPDRWGGPRWRGSSPGSSPERASKSMSGGLTRRAGRSSRSCSNSSSPTTQCASLRGSRR
jgi:hypothetical protein